MEERGGEGVEQEGKGKAEETGGEKKEGDEDEEDIIAGFVLL